VGAEEGQGWHGRRVCEEGLGIGDWALGEGMTLSRAGGFWNAEEDRGMGRKTE
jgi:hypothetical protein